MADTKKYYHNIDVDNNKVINLLLNPLTTVQRTAVGILLGPLDEGYVCFDTTLNQQYFWDGAAWITTGGGGAVWGAITGTLTAQTDLTAYLTANYYPLSSNPAGYLTSSALTPYLTSATAASTYEPIISAGTTSQYWRGDKTWQTFPTIPAAQIQSDWNQTNNTLLDYIKNKPTIPTVGTWGALNYPTWTTGTPFVKMTAAGTFALDTTSYQPLLTNPVTGTGTATRVAFWDTGSSISSDADLYWDNVNKRLGVGTASPTYKLDVNGEINTNVGIRLGTNGAQTGIYGGANIFDFWAGNNKIATWGLAPSGGTHYDHFASPVYNTGDSGILSIFKIRGSVTSNSANAAGTTQLDVSPIYTQQTFGTGTFRGVYYHPQLNSLNGSTHIAWENTSGDIIHGNLATGGADEMVTVDISGKLKKQTIPTGGSGTVTSIATSGLISGGTITISGTISTSMATDKLVGRYSASTGVMEEVTVGSGLTLTGTGVLNNTATPTPLGYYGAWQDMLTQTAAASNVGYPLIFRTIDLENQVRVVTNGTDLTRITFDNTGIYNLQFSVQVQNTDNAQHDVTIWIRKNGVDVTGSSGFISIPARKSAGAGNEGHGVYGWNYLLSVVAGEYYEIVWSTSDATHITIQYYAGGSPPPSTASVLATVTQQSGIMAGTGISRSVNSVSTNTAAGNGANVDYVYLVSGTTTITLPTAVGNTNRYTIKNSGVGVVSIATTSSQTIDDSASPITINVQYVSIDLISDGTNWEII